MRLATLLLLALLPACVTVQQPLEPVNVVHPVEIRRDTVWRGRIVIDRSVKVFKGVTLTIEPGSEILFVRHDDDRDGLGDGTLIIEGSLLALGTRQAPISFRSAAASPQPGDWLEIRVDFSREIHLRYCDIRDSAYTLHAHFTKAVIEDSHIHRNIDGCRLGQGSFILRRNLIEDNEGKGINFRNSTVEIRDNIIRRNGSGIFLFETDRSPIIEHNNLYANGDNLRLGDFFRADLRVGVNWWGTDEPAAVAATVYDRDEDASLGRVMVGVAKRWFHASGPADAVRFESVRTVATDGFVDAAPLVLDDRLVVASWDGRVRLIAANGTIAWETALGEEIDSTLASDTETVFGQTWGREVFALDLATGRKRWSFRYPPSPADDHRQGGVVLVDNTLLVPAWNGSLYALNKATGHLRWSFAGQSPLRAAPLVSNARIYLPGGDGSLWCLDLEGRLLWERRLAAPLLSKALPVDNGLAVLDRNGILTAFSADGILLWQRALDGPCYYAAPAALGPDLLVASAAGSLWRLAARDGAVVWRQDGFGPIYATPVLSSGRVAVGDNDGVFWLLDAESGAVLDRHHVGAPLQGGPVAYGDLFVVGSRDRHVHLFKLIETALP